MDFGLRLKNYRSKRKMTQHELASAVGVSTVCIGNWERGARKPTLDMLISLSSVLNISIDSLVGVSVSNVEQPILSIDEMTLLNNYKELDVYGRKAVDTICLLEKKRVDAEKAKPYKKVIAFQKSERYIPH